MERALNMTIFAENLPTFLVFFPNIVEQSFFYH